MRITRIYQAGTLSFDQPHISLDERACHYLMHVLRAKAGDQLQVFDDEANEFTAIIVHISKRGIQIQLQSVMQTISESPLHIHLAQSIARGEKMDFLIQKAVELGVHEITPLFTEYCNVQLDQERANKRQHHWQQIAISACEQSGRAKIPIVHAPKKLNHWLGELPDHMMKFVLSPSAEQSLNLAARKNLFSQVALMIGPEGGISTSELNLLSSCNFMPVHIGRRILRTETAGFVALALLQAAQGDLI